MKDYFNIISYLVLAAIFLLSFKLVEKYLIPIWSKNHKWILLLWERIQIVSWLSIFLLFYAMMLRDNQIFTLVLSMVIFGLGWEYWRNLFSGIIIKFTNQFEVGDRISSTFVKGKFKSIHYISSQVLNNKGEIVVVPNHLLRSSVHKYLTEKTQKKLFSYTIQTKGNVSLQDVSVLIKKCPYLLMGQEPIIEQKSSNEYLVKLSLIDDQFSSEVKGYLEKVF